MSIELSELDNYIEARLSKMEERPEMFASSMASFEEQYLLLMEIEHEIGYLSIPYGSHVMEEYEKYLKYCQLRDNISASAQHETIQELSRFLKTFRTAWLQYL